MSTYHPTGIRLKFVGPDHQPNTSTLDTNRVTHKLRHPDADALTVFAHTHTNINLQIKQVINKKTNDEFARKSIDKNRLDDEDVEDFYNELKILNSLDHPNIVQVVDAYECEDVVTIIMELCHGGELYDSLISSQSYSEEVRGWDLFSLYSCVWLVLRTHGRGLKRMWSVVSTASEDLYEANDLGRGILPQDGHRTPRLKVRVFLSNKNTLP